MNFKKITFVVNPMAGMGATGREWPSIKELAMKTLGPFDSIVTNRPGDGIEIARHAIQKGSDLIVCVGGDGTFNEILNGYMGENGPIHNKTILGYIPRGTGLDICKSIPIPKDIHKALALLKGSTQPRYIDVGRIKYIDHSFRPSCCYFHNIVSFGLGGEVVGRVNRSNKPLGGFVTFITATLLSLLAYKNKNIQLQVDNNTKIDVRSVHIAVANGRYQGGGMFVAPDAKVDDGLLNVTVIGDLSIAEILVNLHNLYNGKILGVKKIFSFTGKKVELCSDQKVLIDIDGEQPGQLPAAVEILPRTLPIITE